jgi:hypothetical protein
VGYFGASQEIPLPFQSVQPAGLARPLRALFALLLLFLPLLPVVPAAPVEAAGALPAPAVAAEAAPAAQSAITYRFDADLSAEDAALIRTTMALAQRTFGDAGPITVSAGRSHVHAQGDGDVLGDAGPGEITLYTAVWRDEPLDVRQTVVLHEYYHALQFHLAKSLDVEYEEDYEPSDEDVDYEGPRWLVEGTAVYAAARAMDAAGLFPYAKERESRMELAAETTTKLRDLETTAQTARAADVDAHYTLGYFAAELLARTTPNDPYLRTYWTALGEGLTYERAFRRTFGMTLEEFYTRFEAHRQGGYR